jgi:CoA:oxalate CoA-transferase
MLDCQLAILENAVARYLATGDAPGPIGARHPSITPFDAFATSNGYVVVAVGNDALFGKLCDVLGRPELREDPRFATNDGRTDHEAELKEEIESALGQDESESWLERLGAAGIPCAPIQDVEALLRDPQIAARNMIVELDDPEAGPQLRAAGNPIKLSGFPDPKTRPPAPALDADGERIRRELG